MIVTAIASHNVVLKYDKMNNRFLLGLCVLLLLKFYYHV